MIKTAPFPFNLDSFKQMQLEKPNVSIHGSACGLIDQIYLLQAWLRFLISLLSWLDGSIDNLQEKFNLVWCLQGDVLMGFAMDELYIFNLLA